MTGPALRYRAEAVSLALPPLLIAAERVAAAVVQGRHGRRRTGQGETFWQFRQYELGDSVARIDWRESGKSQRVYVRETEWEAAQSVYLWRDGSRSMDYASDVSLPTKRARADLLTLATAVLLVRGGERVALMDSSLAPANGRAVLDRLAMLLKRSAISADLPVYEPLPRHGQIVWFGDWLAPLDAIATLLLRYAKAGLRGHLLQVLDPAEESLPFSGRVRFEGLEDEQSLLVSRVESIRSGYTERLQRHRDGLAAVARAAGWTFAVHHTDHPPQRALLGLYQILTEQ